MALGLLSAETAGDSQVGCAGWGHTLVLLPQLSAWQPRCHSKGHMPSHRMTLRQGQGWLREQALPESPGTASCSTQGLLERLLSTCSVVKTHVHLKTDPLQSEIYNPLS